MNPTASAFVPPSSTTLSPAASATTTPTTLKSKTNRIESTTKKASVAAVVVGPPLEEKTGTTRDGRVVPQLDPAWVTDIDFAPYVAPPRSDAADGATWEERAVALELIADDLQLLLCLPFHKFWSQSVFDVSLHRLLDTYLRLAPRSYDPRALACAPKRVCELERQVSRRVLMTMVRQARRRESRHDHMRLETHGAILYENWLFDVPKIMDLCALYYADNKNLVTSLVCSVFEAQPSYADDLFGALGGVVMTCQRVAQTLDIPLLPDADAALGAAEAAAATASGLEPIPLPPPPLTLTPSSAADIQAYLHDIGATVGAFLAAYPPAAGALVTTEAAVALCGLYNSTVPALRSFWSAVAPVLTPPSSSSPSSSSSSSSSSATAILHKKLTLQPLSKAQHCAGVAALKRASTTLLATCDAVVRACFLQPVHDAAAEEQLYAACDALQPMEALLTDLQLSHQLRSTLQDMVRKSTSVDEARTCYFDTQLRALAERAHAGAERQKQRQLEAEAAAAQEQMMQQQLTKQPRQGKKKAGKAQARARAWAAAAASTSASASAFAAPSSSSSFFSSSTATAAAAAAAAVHKVQEMLPDLGAGYIEVALEACGGDPERVIDRHFSGTLPDHVREIPLDAPSRHLAMQSSRSGRAGARGGPRSIFDGDEFDLRSGRALDPSRVHRGKRDRHNPVLAATAAEERERKAALAVTRAQLLLYEDEYDDTYEDFSRVGAIGDDGGGSGGSSSEEYEVEKDARADDGRRRRFAKKATAAAAAAVADGGDGGNAIPENPNRRANTHWQAEKEARDRVIAQERAKMGAPPPIGRVGVTADKRAIAEKKRAAAQAQSAKGRSGGDRGGGGRGGGGRGRGGRGGRGQGVDLSGPLSDRAVARARAKKDANKASRANHNRKRGAMKKMARGMGAPPPS